MPNDADEMPPFRLTHAQAAAILGIHELSVSRMVWKGRLRTVKRHAKAGCSRSETRGHVRRPLPARSPVVAGRRESRRSSSVRVQSHSVITSSDGILTSVTNTLRAG